jgi:hypothetical protein
MGTEPITEILCFIVRYTAIQACRLTQLRKGKVALVLPLTEHHAMKAYWGSGSTVPPIL